MIQFRLSILAAALLVSACAKELPCECACPPEVQQRVQKQLMRTMTEKQSTDASRKIIVCKPDDPKSCNIDVPVTVDSSGQCYTSLEYCVVCVRRGKAEKGPQVTWRLTVDGKETDQYFFKRQTGIDVYYAGATNKEDFIEPGLAEAGKRSKFKWVAGPDRSSALAHGTSVVDMKGRDCLPADPVLVNSNN